MQKSTPEAHSSTCELNIFFDGISNKAAHSNSQPRWLSGTMIRIIYPVRKGCHFPRMKRLDLIGNPSYPLRRDLALAPSFPVTMSKAPLPSWLELFASESRSSAAETLDFKVSLPKHCFICFMTITYNNCLILSPCRATQHCFCWEARSSDLCITSLVRSLSSKVQRRCAICQMDVQHACQVVVCLDQSGVVWTLNRYPVWCPIDAQNTSMEGTKIHHNPLGSREGKCAARTFARMTVSQSRVLGQALQISPDTSQGSLPCSTGCRATSSLVPTPLKCSCRFALSTPEKKNPWKTRNGQGQSKK